MLVGSFRGPLFIPILSLYNHNINSSLYCIGLGGLTKYLLLNFTLTGIPGLFILYLSTNVVFNFFDTNKSSLKYIFALHFFKVGFPMIVFTGTSLPSPN